MNARFAPIVPLAPDLRLPQNKVSPFDAVARHVLKARPVWCSCTQPCSGREGRAADGSHCREHLTPQLVEDRP